MTATEAQIRASAKWEHENNEKITVKLRKGIDPSKAQIQRAAQREGLSMNSFIIYCIKDKI